MITELVIDRAKWGKSALLNEDGTMCCLGFLSKACGYKDEDLYPIFSLSYPRYEWNNIPDIWRSPRRVAELAGGSIVSSIAARINDSDILSLSEKEIQLIALFADNGITLSFIGDHRE